jgi:hypothetical protein
MERIDVGVGFLRCVPPYHDESRTLPCDYDRMDILKRVEQAILVLERIAAGRGRIKGRPPVWMTQVKRRGRPPGSKNKPKNE